MQISDRENTGVEEISMRTMSIVMLGSLLFTLSLFRKRSHLASCLIFFFFLSDASAAYCIGPGEGYLDMTRIYDMEVGSELVLNCTLRNTTFKEFPRSVSSSDLVFERYDKLRRRGLPRYTEKMDDYTVQLKIPRATENDTASYFCIISSSNIWCTTLVRVGCIIVWSCWNRLL